MLDANSFSDFHRNIGNYTTWGLEGKDTSAVVYSPLTFSLGNLLCFDANGPSNIPWKTKEGRPCERRNLNDHLV
jgi:hypothetical protein